MKQNKTNKQKRFSPGLPPSTERGKRRHNARNEQEKAHAKRVWEGGYLVAPNKKEKE